MQDLLKGLKENRIEELFGAGTACVVSPIDKILYKNEWLEIPTMIQKNPVCMQLHKQLTDIQFGRTRSQWMVEVPIVADNNRAFLSQ